MPTVACWSDRPSGYLLLCAHSAIVAALMDSTRQSDKRVYPRNKHHIQHQAASSSQPFVRPMVETINNHRKPIAHCLVFVNILFAREICRLFLFFFILYLIRLFWICENCLPKNAHYLIAARRKTNPKSKSKSKTRKFDKENAWNCCRLFVSKKKIIKQQFKHCKCRRRRIYARKSCCGEFFMKFYGFMVFSKAINDDRFHSTGLSLSLSTLHQDTTIRSSTVPSHFTATQQRKYLRLQLNRINLILILLARSKPIAWFGEISARTQYNPHIGQITVEPCAHRHKMIKVSPYHRK